MTQKLVTAGCPAGKVGNEPSALCWEAIHVRARSTDFSTCCHFAGGRAAIRELGAAVLETWLVGFSFSAARAASAEKNRSKEASNPGQDLRACVKTVFGVPPLGGTVGEPPKGGTPN